MKRTSCNIAVIPLGHMFSWSMSTITLNLNFDDPSHNDGQKKARHKQFVIKRGFLERRGFLNKKQNKSKNGSCKKNKLHWNRNDHSQDRAVLPKFTTQQPELSTNPSNSTQAHHGNSVTIKKFTVSSKATPQTGSTSILHNPMKYVALDCEMVGTGPKGRCSELARCSIVSYDGDVIYDKFIKPVNPVTDFRTRWSGVRWQDLRNATPFNKAQGEVKK